LGSRLFFRNGWVASENGPSFAGLNCEEKLDSEHIDLGSHQAELERDPAITSAKQPDLEDPQVVLSLLESDQLVAAKRRTHFGPRKLSFGVRILLWTLRVYVVVMMLLALLSVFRAAHLIR
jgi:hypothetical protein